MKNIKKIAILSIFFLFITPIILLVQAATLGFDQATVTVTNGATFQLAVNVDAGGEEILSTDVYITYDASFLKASSVSAGSLFPTVTNDTATSGTVYIAGMVNDPGSPVTASGTVATVSFQALAGGTTNIGFDCTSSKIIKNDINATNIINCSESGTSAVTISTGGSDPAPTSGSDTTEGTTGGTTEGTTGGTAGETGGTTGGTTGQQLPVSGVFDNVIKFAVPGTILLFIGTLVRLLL